MFNVLLVEDEKVIRQGMVVLIEEVAIGFKVLWEAEDGTRAWDILKHETPDVLITDIRMPNMDGLQLIQKTRVLYPEMSVVIVSGYDDFAYARQAIMYGVEDYLLKPIDRVEFVTTMERVYAKCEVKKKVLHESVMGSHPDFRKTNSPMIQQVMSYVIECIGSEITLQSAAELVHVHPNYLSQLFKKETGKTFSQYVREIRLIKAKKLLQETKLKVYDVARISGYVSDKHFIRIFKQEEGMTPKQYRFVHQNVKQSH